MSVTVIAGSAECADALSTAIFVMGAEKGITLAKDLGDIEVIIIREDGSINSYP
jgi:thiamine biosynthesis lipoprotein